MENFEFYNPVRIISGNGEVVRIKDEVEQLGKSALIVSYQESEFMRPLLDSVNKNLTDANIRVTELFDVVANPLVCTAKKGIELCTANQVDVVIGIGGGSVMDTAKIIAAGVKYKGDIWNMFYSRHDKFDNVPPTEALPIITIPTVPATSSEMNNAAVITNEETAEKAYVFGNCLYPTVSILDPELLVSLPAYQTACGAADAISHCLEVYLNNTVKNPVQYGYMEVIARTVIENSVDVLADPENVELRGIQQWTATVAWNGMTTPGMAGFFPMHTIGHTLSAQFNIAHGHTLALIMPAFMRYMKNELPERYIDFARNIMGKDVVGIEEPKAIEAGIDAFEGYLNKIGLKTKLKELDIREVQLEMIADQTLKVYGDDNGLVGAVRPLDRKDILNILQLAFN
ncbi:iron-containing alcohol dehydrogenase [Puteibacter caeruleilacunae]|nr:iron-containing alcohol dehydrogenase [Puteibacter caeruleilacunae]